MKIVMITQGKRIAILFVPVLYIYSGRERKGKKMYPRGYIFLSQKRVRVRVRVRVWG
jgi:hypothetical protein